MEDPTNSPLHQDTQNEGDLTNEIGNQPVNKAIIAADYTKTYLVLGWLCAAFAIVISPLFAIAGIVFGVLVNKRYKGRGNAVVITNSVLGTLSFVFAVMMRLVGLS